MKRYIIKRLIILIPVLLIVSVFAFALVRIMPGGAAMAYLQAANIPPTAEAVKAANAALGLDRPVLEQYFTWMSGVLRWDFGVSYINNQISVGHEINGALVKTAYLTSGAVLWSLVIGIPLGIGAAHKPNGKFDFFSRVVSFVSVSTPQFLSGFLFILFFSLYLGWFPSYGAKSFLHYVLPSFTLGIGYITYNSRLLRNSLIENKGYNYVLYARARGLSERAVMNTHVLRNSIIPLVTMICLNIGHMIAGSVLVESVFAIPGMGSLIVGAISSRDYPIIQGWIVVMAIIFLVINLIADIACALANPQVRYKEGGI
ncbi:MAG: ABC transporter permease [Peptococcaceae bacterium]